MTNEPNDKPIRRSAAHLTVPKKAVPVSPLVHPTKRDWDAVYRNLRAWIADCGPKANKNDKATAGITGCIVQGIDEGKLILGTLRTLGFNTRHAGMLLRIQTGDNAQAYHWRRDAEGRYHVHG